MRIFYPLPFAAWLAWCIAHGEIRWELFVVTGAVFSLVVAGKRTEKLLDGLYPVGLLGLVYDTMRFVKNIGVTPERIHICDLRAIDMKILSVHVNDVPGSVHDWFQLHHSTPLDLICALPYGTFIGATVLFALFLYRRDPAAMRAFGWTFLILNICGFVTYHLYPAAPPWYFHEHGCVADVAARASEGPRLRHVDALLGFQYFGGFYGRANDVYGAVPSLHVAYPLLILLYGWRHFGPWLRTLSNLFLVSMCFAAVYLDHHWIVDVLLGVAYTVVVFVVVGSVLRNRTEQGEGVSLALGRTDAP